MKKIVVALALAGAVSSGSAMAALSAGDQYNVDQIRQGNPQSLRSAAENIYSSGAAPEVLDVLAEALLQNAGQGGNTYIDALSWSCKALGNSGNKRYYTVLKQVADGGNRKLAKHCGRAASDLGSADGEQYAQGMASLTATNSTAGSKASAKNPLVAAAAAESASNSGGSHKPISEVTVGMSMQQAVSIAGPPDSVNAYITGKAFIPFNFKGGDTHREVGHYKGQGRIIYSNTSAYSSNQRVLEVQIDPNESGYP